MDSFWDNIFKTSLVRVLTCFLIFLKAGVVHASDPPAVALLLSNNAPFYQEATAKIKATLNQKLSSPPAVVSYQIDNIQLESFDQQKYTLIITVGTKASQFAADHLQHTPTLAIFITRSGYKSIGQKLSADRTAPFSAIYLDQPLSRLFALCEILLPKAKNVGTVLGPISKGYMQELVAIAAKKDLNLHTTLIKNTDNPVSALKPILRSSELFIAIPDQAILNRSVAKWILYLSYSEKIPVIGFSQAYTDAGALASVFSSPEDIGKQTGELLAKLLSHNDPGLWRPQYPIYFTIKGNPAVARSLGIALPTHEQLKTQLSNAELNRP